MISKNVFLDQIEKIQTFLPEPKMSEAAIMLYYDFMSPDFTDEEFIQAANLAVKNNFKFPPVAAFYREHKPHCVPSPVTAEESEIIRKTRAKYE
jgi:hypothetical protein